jgi:hypothetical protein
MGEMVVLESLQKVASQGVGVVFEVKDFAENYVMVKSTCNE